MPHAHHKCPNCRRNLTETEAYCYFCEMNIEKMHGSHEKPRSGSSPWHENPHENPHINSPESGKESGWLESVKKIFRKNSPKK